MKSTITWFTALSLTVAMTGCSSLNLLKFGDRIPTATAKNPAVRCVCLWQEGEGQGIDGRPSRGFAGQVFFFTHNSHSPVAVDGDVRIFLFDDRGDQGDEAKPLHQFDFVEQSWNTHLFDSQFGPVYRIFVPYPRKGMESVDAALRVRLVRENRPPLFSDLTAVKLAGQDKENESKLGQMPEFHDHRILQRNGAVKITHREIRSDAEQLDDYLKNNSRTLGTEEEGRMARDVSFEKRVQLANHQAAESRMSAMEGQLQQMLAQERARIQQEQATRQAPAIFDSQVQQQATQQPYDEPNRFPGSDAALRRADDRATSGAVQHPGDSQTPMSYSQAVQQFRQLSQENAADQPGSQQAY
jgi:hypothetical protein